MLQPLFRMSAQFNQPVCLHVCAYTRVHAHILGTKPRASHMPRTCPTTELHHQLKLNLTLLDVLFVYRFFTIIHNITLSIFICKTNHLFANSIHAILIVKF